MSRDTDRAAFAARSWAQRECGDIGARFMSGTCGGAKVMSTRPAVDQDRFASGPTSTKHPGPVTDNALFPARGRDLVAGLPGAASAQPLIEALFGPFEQGAMPVARGLAARRRAPGVAIVQPGEGVVLA